MDFVIVQNIQTGEDVACFFFLEDALDWLLEERDLTVDYLIRPASIPN